MGSRGHCALLRIPPRETLQRNFCWSQVGSSTEGRSGKACTSSISPTLRRYVSLQGVGCFARIMFFVRVCGGYLPTLKNRKAMHDGHSCQRSDIHRSTRERAHARGRPQAQELERDSRHSKGAPVGQTSLEDLRHSRTFDLRGPSRTFEDLRPSRTLEDLRPSRFDGLSAFLFLLRASRALLVATAGSASKFLPKRTPGLAPGSNT